MATPTTVSGSDPRRVLGLVHAHRQLEGAGFIVRRPFPARELALLDPFLLLDEMGPVDYAPGEAVGAPQHPHRGFETVTYLLAGEMEHADSAGHVGRLGPGDVQWMTAGRGLVHSELPSARHVKEGGRMHGFQLWVNLPARDKLMPPCYQDIPRERIPRATSADGRADVVVIAGEALGERAVIETRTPIVVLDWTLRPGAVIEQPLGPAYDGFVYVFGGHLRVGRDATEVHDGSLARLSMGDSVRLAVLPEAREPARALLVAGVPIREPVARYGPFVMNTEAEIRQAVADFRAGRLTRA